MPLKRFPKAAAFALPSTIFRSAGKGGVKTERRGSKGTTFPRKISKRMAAVPALLRILPQLAPRKR